MSRDIEDVLAQREWLAAWYEALTDAQREAVQLCWVEGYTMREAGDVLGIAHESVRDRLDWARKKWAMTAQTASKRV